MEEIPPSEMKKRCRFCLKKSSTMRAISLTELERSDIPKLYETVTAVKLVISTDYSLFVCQPCKDQMNTAAQIRADFLKIDEFWKGFIKTRMTGSSSCTAAGASSSREIKEEEEVDQVDPLNFVMVMCEESNGLVKQQLSENNIDCDNNAIDMGSISSTDDEHNTTKDPKQIQKTNLKSLHVNPDFQCSICTETITSKLLLLKHMRAHAKTLRAANKQSVCHICGKQNLKKMAAHLRIHQIADNYKCSYCNRAFNRRINMEQHERTHTGEKPFFCEICGSSFISVSGLSRHRKMHAMATAQREKELNTVKSPQQPKPAIVFKPSDAVTDKLVCPVCSTTFTHRRSLLQHLKLQHVDGPDIYKRLMEVTCMTCFKSFATAEELAVHRTEHVEHECAICKRCFDNKLTLQYHQQTHSTKERSHRCDICGCGFAVKKTLRLHFLRIHTEHRPHACSMCGKTFLLRSYLNTHIKTVHSQARPFQCQECPKSYKTAALLRYHQEKHTGKFRYSCSICSKPCHNGPLLTTHMKNHHPGVGD